MLSLSSLKSNLPEEIKEEPQAKKIPVDDLNVLERRIIKLEGLQNYKTLNEIIEEKKKILRSKDD